jgi:hypothetical protein
VQPECTRLKHCARNNRLLIQISNSADIKS